MAARKNRFALLVTTLAIVSAAGGALLARHELAASVPVLHAGTWLPQPRPVAPFSLVDEQGRPFTEKQLQGQPSLLFFGFTHCPDVCPNTLALLSQLEQRAALPGLRTIVVSVDPERDTPAAMDRYLEAFSPQFIGLTGGAPGLPALARSLGAVHTRDALPGGEHRIDHSGTLYLLNAQGELTAVFTPPLSAPALQADLGRAAGHLGASAGREHS